MTCIVTYMEVQPGFTVQAIALFRQYRQSSSEEIGKSGIDVLQEIHRENRFVLIEAWNDESAFQTHEGAEHTAQFRSKLRDIQSSPYDQRVHHGFAVGSRREAVEARTLFVVTHVDVPPPRREETEVLLKSLAGQSPNDWGSVQYDVFQQNAPRTNHFTVIAAWNDEKAFASHQAQPHTRQFREALGPMLGAPYDERLYKHVN
jgi:quinol monooxygenase YgiN